MYSVYFYGYFFSYTGYMAEIFFYAYFFSYAGYFFSGHILAPCVEGSGKYLLTVGSPSWAMAPLPRGTCGKPEYLRTVGTSLSSLLLRSMAPVFANEEWGKDKANVVLYVLCFV